jgi:hypothetical protein
MKKDKDLLSAIERARQVMDRAWTKSLLFHVNDCQFWIVGG